MLSRMGLRRMSARDADASGRVASPLELVEFDDTVVIFGYVIMRLAMVGQWVPLAVSDPASRGTAVRFAVAITGVQVLWVARLAFPEAWQLWTFFPVHVAAARRESGGVLERSDRRARRGGAPGGSAVARRIRSRHHRRDLVDLLRPRAARGPLERPSRVRVRVSALRDLRGGGGGCRPGWRSRSTRSPGRRKCRMLSPDSPRRCRSPCSWRWCGRCCCAVRSRGGCRGGGRCGARGRGCRPSSNGRVRRRSGGLGGGRRGGRGRRGATRSRQG